MESISRICATSKGTTIDAIGQGRYRVCNRQAVCSDVEGLWQPMKFCGVRNNP